MRARILSIDFAITCVFFALAVIALVQAWSWPFRAALFPIGTAGVLLLVTTMKIVLDLVSRKKPAAAPVQHNEPNKEEEDADAELTDVFATASGREWRGAVGWMALFFLTLWLLGALVAVPLFALVYLLVVSRESKVLAFSYAFATWAFTYGLFDRILHVPLPRGVLLNAMGWV